MYPQYSATTTASVIDNVNRYLTKERWQPTLRFVPPYYDDEIYIDAIYKHIKKNLKQKKLKTKKILCSFHGIPKNISIKEIHITVTVQKQSDYLMKNLRREGCIRNVISVEIRSTRMVKAIHARKNG